MQTKSDDDTAALGDTPTTRIDRDEQTDNRRAEPGEQGE
jgi:hypothetical protein